MNYVVRSISGRIFHQLIDIYKQGILLLGTGKVLKHGINGYCDCAIIAYPLAVAIWEAFLYETILSHWSFSQNKDSKINCIPAGNIDNWDILTKTAVIPDLLYDKTFDKGSQPFQDLSNLVFIRNSIVHFKCDCPNKRLISAIKDLSQRNVFFDFSKNIVLEPNEVIPFQDWTTTISTIEGIRWAINTIANMAYKLKELTPKKKQDLIFHTIDNYKTISEIEATKLFVNLGVDPNLSNLKRLKDNTSYELNGQI